MAAVKTSTLSPKSGSPSLSVRVGRERSSSIVKVEKVGEESQEETADQGVYDNVNAEWVNRKGPSPFPARSEWGLLPPSVSRGTRSVLTLLSASRCMDDPPCPHMRWEGRNRHNPWYAARN